jgi:hypothetical protein
MSAEPTGDDRFKDVWTVRVMAPDGSEVIRVFSREEVAQYIGPADEYARAAAIASIQLQANPQRTVAPIREGDPPMTYRHGKP